MLYLSFFAIFVVVVFFVIKLLNKIKKHNAAMNALLAKYLISESLGLKENIHSKIELILERDMQCSIEKARHFVSEMQENVYYTFAALAMAELGINPPIDIWVWQPVTNPFVALLGASKEILVARVGLEKKGIFVKINQ